MPLLFESGRMDGMPKKIDPQLRARCVRLVREQAQEYPTQAAAVTVVARQGASRGNQCDAGSLRQRSTMGPAPGVTSVE